MKNKPLYQRFSFAINGILGAWKTESSFRVHTAMSAGVLLFMLWLRPAPVWWALILLTIGGVLSAELLNTALEQIVDRLHPKQHPLIGKAKDCAAGAVLVLSLVSVLLFILMLIACFGAA
jgi:undecaprenol kinase